MRTFNLCIIGFGNVSRALLRLLLWKRQELRERYSIDWRLTGLASRRLGWLADAGGLDAERLLAEGSLSRAAGAAQDPDAAVRSWLAAARGDVLFELTPVAPQNGEPAVTHLRAALDSGAHAVTANKAAVVFGYHDLEALARARGRRFFFEATVLGGTPVFSLFREALPAVKVQCIRGLLNSTTSLILSEVERGRSFDEALAHAQQRGIAEADPSNDVDGWDAALKAAVLACVLMDSQVKPAEIERRGIRGLDAGAVREAHAAGRRVRLVARIDRTLLGRVVASVAPETLEPDDPLAAASPSSGVLYVETDTLHGLTIASHRQGPDTTAYGCFADFLAAVKQ